MVGFTGLCGSVLSYCVFCAVVASTPGLRFREAISGDLAVLETCVEKLGERLRPSMNPFLVSMDKVAEIIDQAAQTTKPEGDALYEFLDPIAQEMEIVTEVRDGVQAKELLESHILSLGEAIQMLGWLASEDPISVVEEVREMSLKQNCNSALTLW